MVSRSWRYVVALAAVCFLPACESAGQAPAPSPAGSHGETPISVEVNQSRDQYGKQAILIQLTNNTEANLTVSDAVLRSNLFRGDITWRPEGGALDLPPKQPKSLPATLPAASCLSASDAPITATIHYTDPAREPKTTSTDASDPFNVLPRNSDELCLSAEAAATATIVLDPGLEVAPDGATAVVRLVITPVGTSGGTAPGLTIESIDGTTLLAEVPGDPWPRSVTVTANTEPEVVPLRIRPARCDPHAVAEDKVGTLLPLRVTVGDRKGLLKVAASTELRGRIYDFVSTACGTG
ncbi:hypothetical protein ACIQTZ_11310 [Paenarthrobacter sp. NPDC090520]|uniref:hypothetical protein n=1 Tax=Paenarthrobacter sp. NPDC090520 TaxID=3364382 RepID=UPI00381C62F9